MHGYGVHECSRMLGLSADNIYRRGADEASAVCGVVFRFDWNSNRQRDLAYGQVEISGCRRRCLFCQLRQPGRFLQARLPDHVQPTLHDCV
jgi:hypothetical protein